MRARRLTRAVALALLAGWAGAAAAQVPPSAEDKAGYAGLLAAAARGDAAQIKALVAAGQKPDGRDAYGRTPLHVAAYGGHHEAMRALVAAGADPNALERSALASRVVDGSDQPIEATELWTFVRPNNASWMLSAIQQTS